MRNVTALKDDSERLGPGVAGVRAEVLPYSLLRTDDAAVQNRSELGHVMPVCSGDDNRQRDPTPVHENVTLCPYFFSRSFGSRPTDSSAVGTFVMLPSTLCHLQAIPAISSYSASPRFQILRKSPAFVHSWKYLCTLLELPKTDGNAFHWIPVLSTKTIASNA